MVLREAEIPLCHPPGSVWVPAGARCAVLCLSSPVALSEVSAEEKCMLKPHKVQLLTVRVRAGSKQLPAALSATSVADIS